MKKLLMVVGLVSLLSGGANAAMTAQASPATCSVNFNVGSLQFAQGNVYFKVVDNAGFQNSTGYLKAGAMNTVVDNVKCGSVAINAVASDGTGGVRSYYYNSTSGQKLSINGNQVPANMVSAVTPLQVNFSQTKRSGTAPGFSNNANTNPLN